MTGVIMAPLAVGEDFDNLDDDEVVSPQVQSNCNNENSENHDPAFDFGFAKFESQTNHDDAFNSLSSESQTNHDSNFDFGSPESNGFNNSDDWFTGIIIRDSVDGDSVLKTSYSSNCAKSDKDMSNNNCRKDSEGDTNSDVISCNSARNNQLVTATNSGSQRPCSHSRSASNPVQTFTDQEFFPAFKRTNSSSSSEFCSSPTKSVCEGVVSPVRTSSQAVLRGRQARWEMKSNNKPIARPRSTTPISIATYDDYVSFESKKVARQESLSPVSKLKIVLPGEEFEPRLRSPRKSPKKSPGEMLWSNFDETGLFRCSAIVSDPTSPLKSPKRVIMPSSLPTSPRESLTTSPNDWIAFNDDDIPQTTISGTSDTLSASTLIMSGGLLEDFKELTSSAIPSQKGKRHDSHILKAPKDPSTKGSPLKSLINFGKKKILKEKKEEKDKKDKHELQIDDFVIPDGSTVDENTEEWQAFQQLLARSKATVEITKSNISKLEKTTSVGEGATIDVPKPSGSSWEAFDAGEEEEEIAKTQTVSPPVKSVTPPDISFDDEPDQSASLVDTSIDTNSALAALKISPAPSPVHQPIPPQNSRRESIDDFRNMEDDGIEELNLELQTVPCPAPDVDASAEASAGVDSTDTTDVLGLFSEPASPPPEYKKSRSSSVNEDLLANLGLENLSPSGDVYDGMFSGQSSGVTTPVHRGAYDVYHVPGGSEFANQLVDDFLGVAAEPPPPVSEQQDILDKIASLVPKRTDESSNMSDPFDFGFGDIGSTNNNVNNTVSIGGVTNTASDMDDIFGLGMQSSNNTDHVDASMTTSAHNPFLDNDAPSNDAGFLNSGLDDFLGVPVKTSPLTVQNSEMMHDSSFEPESDKEIGDEDFFDPRAAAGDVAPAPPVNGELDVWGQDSAPPAQNGEEFKVDFFHTDEADGKAVPAILETNGGVSNDLFADTNKNVVADFDVNDVFANSQNDAFFTQVDEAGTNNPFLTGDTDEDNSAFSTKNPFVDHVDALVESQQKPDFDAVFGEELEMPNFESVCALKAVGSSNEYEDPPENTATLEVFDPFQTIHPTSGDDDHPPGGVSDGDDDDEPQRAIQAFKISDTAKKSDIKSTFPAPALPPPPKTHLDTPPRFNPFDKPDSSSEDEDYPSFPQPAAEEEEEEEKSGPPARPPPPVIMTKVRTPSEEEWIPEELPLFHEPFEGAGWHLMLRQPAKKKITANRYWKKCWVKMAKSESSLLITCWEDENEKYKIQELTVQPCYSVSEESLQQFDQYGKIHTFKIQYVFYKERVGIRPDRITTQNIQNLVKHKPKPAMILDHAPQISELMKLGSLDQEVLRTFIHEIEDSLMKLVAHRDKTLSYAKDEISAEVWDEYKALVDIDGRVIEQKGRVRLFVLGFVTGMPACELGINDKRRDGKEVVGRHDIIPLKTEDWIRIQDCEFHSTVDLAEFEKNNSIRFHPLDACQVELVRFRIPLRENKELPLQLRVKFIVTKGKEPKVDIRGDVMIPGYYSSEEGQVPCEDIQIRIPLPEQWIYFFRVERRFGYGSVHAAKRKPGKIKGLERITMMAQGFAPPSLIEVDVGSAKYEHVYRSIVWRIGRLPDRNHGAYKTHLFSCHLDLGPHDEIPETYGQYCRVEYTMPGSTVSKCAVRSISCENPTPPEKWVRYIAKYDYMVEIDNVLKEDPDAVDVADNKEPAIEQDYAI